MPDNIVKYPSYGRALVHTASRRDVDDNFPQDDRESSPLTSGLHLVRNSTTRRTGGFFPRVWHSLRTSDDSYTAGNACDEEGTELTEIFTQGEALHRQAGQAHAPVNEEPVPGAWKGSLLKRCLIGAGIVAGTGVLGGTGYRYYAGRNSTFADPGSNATWSARPDKPFLPADQHRGSGGTLEDSFGNQMLPHYDSPPEIEVSESFPAMDSLDTTLPPESAIDDIEFLREMDLIEKLRVTDLDVILNGTESFHSKNKREIESSLSYPAFISISLMSLFFIGIDTDLIKNELKKIYWIAKYSPDVNRYDSQEEKDFRHLLKCIELVAAYKRELFENHHYTDTAKAITDLYSMLDNIAGRLSDPYRRTAVKKFREFMDKHSTQNNEAVNNRDISLDNVEPMSAAVRSLKKNAEFNLEYLFLHLMYLRSANFLQKKGMPSEYRKAAISFLNGKTGVKKMYFHDYRVNGVFVIPVGEVGGVLLSMDESDSFIIRSKRNTHKIKNNQGKYIPLYPQEEKFKKWILNRLPDSVAASLKNDRTAFLMIESIQNSHISAMLSIDSPYSFGILKYDDLFEDIKQRINEKYPNIDNFVNKYSNYFNEWLNKRREISSKITAETEAKAKAKAEAKAKAKADNKVVISETIETHQEPPFIYSRYYVSKKNEVAPKSKESDISISVKIYTNPYGKKEVIISESGFPVSVNHLYPCIITRDELSYAEIFRQIGKSLMRPITTLALESQLINKHVTLQNGCPLDEEQTALTEYTMKFDDIVTSIISLMPSAMPIIIAQGLIGPVMVMIADDIDGKSADLNLVKDTHANLLNICTQIVRAQINHTQMKPQEVKDLSNFMPLDMTYKKRTLYITIYGKKKALIYKDQRLYVQGGHLNEVYYNRGEEVWKYVDDTLNSSHFYNSKVKFDEVDNYEELFMGNYQLANGNHNVNQVNNAARYYSLRYSDEQTIGGFLAKILRKSNILSTETASEFSENIDKQVVPVTLLLDQPRRIINNNQLLHIKRGEILSFLSENENGEQMFYKHHLIALGNGRFCGIRNEILTGDTNNKPRFLTAEQLGTMENGLLSSFPDPQKKFHLYSGYPANRQSPYLYSLYENAELLARNKPGNFIKEVSTVLENSGSLSPEQAEQFYQKANLLIQSGLKKTGLQALSSLSFVGERRIIFGEEFKNVDAGRLILIHDKSGKSVSIALSLGEGKFLTDNSEYMVTTLSQNKNIVDSVKMSELFPEEHFSFTENSLDISKLRTGCLLGNDAFLSFSPHSATLTVRAHGAPGNVNMLNPFEFADVIRGLLIYKEIDIRQVKKINLEACFGGLGLPSLGEALASLLNKKVVAYSGRFSVNQRDNPSRWSFMVKTYESSDNEFDRNAIISQCERNYRIMNALANIYNYLTRKRVARSDESLTISTGSISNVPFDVLMSNVARLVLHKITIEAFIQLQPEYDNTDRNALEIIVGEYSPSNAYDFIERCMDIFVLNENGFLLFNQALSYNN